MSCRSGCSMWQMKAARCTLLPPAGECRAGCTEYAGQMLFLAFSRTWLAFNSVMSYACRSGSGGTAPAQTPDQYLCRAHYALACLRDKRNIGLKVSASTSPHECACIAILLVACTLLIAQGCCMGPLCQSTVAMHVSYLRQQSAACRARSYRGMCWLQCSMCWMGWSLLPPATGAFAFAPHCAVLLCCRQISPELADAGSRNRPQLGLEAIYTADSSSLCAA